MGRIAGNERTLEPLTGSLGGEMKPERPVRNCPRPTRCLPHRRGAPSSGAKGSFSLTCPPGLPLQIIRKALSEEKQVSTKTSAADLVTETDHLVEDLIISEMQKRFPSHR